MPDAIVWGPVIEHDASGQPVPRGTWVCVWLAGPGARPKPAVFQLTTQNGAIWRRRAGQGGFKVGGGLRVLRYQVGTVDENANREIAADAPSQVSS